MSPEQLQEKARSLRQRLREKEDSLGAPARRAVKKRIRRLQRKRRKLLAARERAAAKPKAEKKEG